MMIQLIVMNDVPLGLTIWYRPKPDILRKKFLPVEVRVG
jgi:hypothetical protein